jgi:hypothetical protein
LLGIVPYTHLQVVQPGSTGQPDEFASSGNSLPRAAQIARSREVELLRRMLQA